MKSILETSRCLIRLFQENDIITFMKYRNHEQWMKYQQFKGLSYKKYKEILLSKPCIEKGIQLAIIEKGNNQIIGDLFLLKEEDHYWIGYTIAPWKARQGFAYENVNCLLDYLHSINILSIYAEVDPQNIASIHLLKKLGFVLTQDDIYVHIKRCESHS